MSHEKEPLPRWANELDPALQDLMRMGKLKGLDQRFIQSCEPLADTKMKSDTKTSPRVVDKDHPPQATYNADHYEPSGRYRWLLGPDVLGQGGMGKVYDSFDTVLGNEVAIKVIDITLAFDPIQSARFEREAKTMANLSHPALVTVYDYIEDNDRLMYVMEKLDTGEYATMKKWRGKQGQKQSLTTLAGLCDVVDYCWKKGVVHRDLKPGNMMVDRAGNLKLIDFGISNWTVDDTGDQAASWPYISPERARSKQDSSITIESEIFSIGTIFYEMLVGERFFTQHTPLEVGLEIIRFPTLSDEKKKALIVAAEALGFDGEKVASAVDKTHASNPDDRYHSASQFFSDIASAKKA